MPRREGRDQHLEPEHQESARPAEGRRARHAARTTQGRTGAPGRQARPLRAAGAQDRTRPRRRADRLGSPICCACTAWTASSTNTTLSRDGVEESPIAKEAGGSPRAPLLARSTGVLGKARRRAGRRSADHRCRRHPHGADAAAKIEAGARLVQLYTGFIYRGPALIAEAAAAIAAARAAGV